MNYINLLIHPVRFFRNQLEKEKLSYWLPILFILVTSVFVGLTAANVVQDMDLSQGEVTAAKALSFVFAGIGSLFSMVAGWLIKSAILNFILKKMGGEGDYKRSTYVIGMANFPMVIHSLVKLIFLQPVDMENIFEFDWISTLGSLINVFSIWQIALTIIGLSIFYGLSYKKTAIPVIGLEAVVVALSLGYSLISLNSAKSLAGLSALE